MDDLIHIDEWSSIHIIATMSIGMFMGARKYSFISTLAVVTIAGILWEIFEYIYPDSNEIWIDHTTDILINTIGLTIGYLLGYELKK